MGNRGWERLRKMSQVIEWVTGQAGIQIPVWKNQKPALTSVFTKTCHALLLCCGCEMQTFPLTIPIQEQDTSQVTHNPFPVTWMWFFIDFIMLSNLLESGSLAALQVSLSTFYGQLTTKAPNEYLSVFFFIDLLSIYCNVTYKLNRWLNIVVRYSCHWLHSLNNYT